MFFFNDKHNVGRNCGDVDVLEMFNYRPQLHLFANKIPLGVREM